LDRARGRSHSLCEKLKGDLGNKPLEDRLFGCGRRVDVDESQSPSGRDDERKSLGAFFQPVTDPLVACLADLIGYGVAVEGFLNGVLEGRVDELPEAPDSALHEP
jgi:hypothetical protein